nr:putative reverse transcriptase domain-containing protein [Tanacetum cinerariifolium]
MEEEEEEEMEIEDEMNNPKIINPYENEEGELPPPPANSNTSSDSEPEVEGEDENEAATVGTITRAPYRVRPFSGTTYVGSGSSRKVFSLGPIGKDVDILHHKVKSLTQQMFERANTEYSTLKRLSEMDRYLGGISMDRRSETRKHYELKQSVSTLEDQMRGLILKIKKKRKVSRIYAIGCDDLCHFVKQCNYVLTLLVKQAIITRSMPPKVMSQAAIERLITQRVNAGLEAERASQANIRGKEAMEMEQEAMIGYLQFANGKALTWWNSQVATLGLEVANGKSWGDMKKMMLEEFCPDEEGHTRNHCPNKNNPQGEEARGRAYVIKEADKNQGPNVVMGTFLHNNCYATVLFDLGSDKSFVNTSFSHLIDIDPVRLDTSYEVELADGRVASTNIVLKGCTINLVDYLFKMDLMRIELGTFDVIIGMDWLVEQHAVIVCGKKGVHVPYKKKTLVVEGDRGASRLKVISCIKARKYIERGSQLFVAHVIEKEPQEKRLEDVTVIRDFPEVFPDNLPGLPPPRQVEF